MSSPLIALIEACDFESFPAGGQLSMARSLMRLYGERLTLVGMSETQASVGHWTTRQIGSSRYRYFAVAQRRPSAGKPLIPARLSFYAGLRRYKSRILSLRIGAAFTQSPEALLAISNWEWASLSFMFAGTENPLKLSRYWFARRLGPIFDRALFSALQRACVVFVNADEPAIETLLYRSKGRLSRERLIQTPTCVDISEFSPAPMNEARADLGISPRATVFVNHGRISRLKGWEFLAGAFEAFLRRHGDAWLFFVGDGEDRPGLQKYIRDRGLASRVRITGFQKPEAVARYLNAANAAVFGSYVEGWSVAMLEALACGKAIVSTEVSGTSAMIVPGKNGFVVASRNPVQFADAMDRAVRLPEAAQVSIAIASELALARMGERLAAAWPPFRMDGLVRPACAI